MGKDKRPRKRKSPESESLVPPRPPRSEPVVVHARPLLFRFIQGVRTAIGIMLDAADAAADSIRQNLEGRAH